MPVMPQVNGSLDCENGSLPKFSVPMKSCRDIESGGSRPAFRTTNYKASDLQEDIPMGSRGTHAGDVKTILGVDVNGRCRIRRRRRIGRRWLEM